MKKAKRVLALLLCLVLILSAVGCSAKKDDGKKSSDSDSANSGMRYLPYTVGACRVL